MKDSFVCVRRFLIPTQAQLALNELTAAGISAFLSGELTANTFAGNTSLGSQLGLYAQRDQLKRVHDILLSLQSGHQLPDDWEDSPDIMEGVRLCPGCDEAVEIEEKECPYCSTAMHGDSAEK